LKSENGYQAAQIGQLNSQVTQLNTQINAAASTNTQLNSQIAQLNGQITQISSQLSDAAAQNNQLKADKDQLTSQVAQLTALINSEGKLGAYAVIDVTDVSNADAFKTALADAVAGAAAAGGRTLVRDDAILALDGTVPKQFIIVGFESVDKAKAWNDSPAMKVFNTIRGQTTTSRAFVVDGM
jgi:uncharacterized protein (DUF1330 family)/outer membrane murein-binding lipoprotein Lpp